MNANNADQAKWIDKVQKLLAKAASTDSQEEADALFARAQDLMVRKNIEEAMLQAAGKGKEDRVTSEGITIARSGFFKVMGHLVIEVAKANNVKPLWRQPKEWGKAAGVALVGWESDIERVKMMYASLLLQSIRASREVPEEFAGDAKKAAYWRRDFRMGYAVRIGQRLREQIELTKVEVAKETGNSDFLPALRDRMAPVQELVDMMAGKKVRSRTNYDPAAYGAGHAAANSADLGNTRVGGKRKELG